MREVGDAFHLRGWFKLAGLSPARTKRDFMNKTPLFVGGASGFDSEKCGGDRGMCASEQESPVVPLMVFPPAESS